MKKKHGFEELEKVVEFQLEYPDIAPERIAIIDAKILTRIITPARVELIKAIKKKHPKTVSELCKIVKRRKEPVSRDLKILENYGILEMIKSGKTKKPVFLKEAIVLRT